MIKDLLRIKDEIDCLIETYKDLHPDDNIHYDLMDNGEYVVDDVGQAYNPTNIKGEEYEKTQALKRIREGSYENKFRESKGKKITGSSQGQSTLCVYGDSWDEWYKIPSYGSKWRRHSFLTKSTKDNKI